MPRKILSPKWDDPDESKRFLDAAKAADASDDPKALEKAFKQVAQRDGK